MQQSACLGVLCRSRAVYTAATALSVSIKRPSAVSLCHQFSSSLHHSVCLPPRGSDIVVRARGEGVNMTARDRLCEARTVTLSAARFCSGSGTCGIVLDGRLWRLLGLLPRVALSIRAE